MCIAICLVVTAASAQKVTQKDLQGNWKLSALNVAGIYVDVVKSEVTVSKEMEAQMAPEMIQQVKAGMLQSINELKTSATIITGNTIKLTMGPEEETGQFTVIEHDGSQFLSVTNVDGSKDELRVELKAGQLHLFQMDEGQQTELIYSK